MKAFIAKKIRRLLADLLGQGLAPKRLACAMALGLTIGMLPCPWGSTAICALVAILLRVNHVAIQVANYLAWPFQILFFIPFFRAGQKILPFGGSLPLDNLTFSAFHQPLDSLKLLLIADAKAVTAWLLAAPLIYLFIYCLAVPIFSRTPRNLHPQPPLQPVEKPLPGPLGWPNP